MSIPALSVLVCSYNNEGMLDQCLTAIRQSTFTGYELIVVDDGSTDGSFQVAERLADKAIRQNNNSGRSHARNTCATHARSDIFVFIDSDIIITSHTLFHIYDFFQHQHEIAAVTGYLSKQHINTNFPSQYKNLYMHYVFIHQPKEVSFLYGSIHAMRRDAYLPYGDIVKIADDTALGQRLIEQGRKIYLLRELEVIHLKRYTLASLLKNDFLIPRDMAVIFIRLKGWKQLGRNNTGFVHSSKRQLLSIIIASSSLLLLILPLPVLIPGLLLLTWAILMFPFILFLSKEKNWLFGIQSFVFTFIDQLVMATGIIAGFITGLVKAPAGKTIGRY